MQNRAHSDLDREAALRRRAAGRDAAADVDADRQPHPLVALGGRVGNAAVARMLAQREGAPGEEEEVAAKHDPIQREEEEEVAAKHDHLRRAGEEEGEEMLSAQHDPLQREGDEDELQARPEVGLEGGPLSPALSGRINAQRGAGAGLDGGTRATMESSFGTSFADVRVHTDGEADALNRSISAKAFTTGSDIFFRRDASPGDHSLLAHELTHVVQQRAGGGGGGMSVGPAGDAHEQQADAASTAVTSGTAAQAQREAAEEDEAMAMHDQASREEAADEEQV